jgi:hypothetical protein
MTTKIACPLPDGPCLSSLLFPILRVAALKYLVPFRIQIQIDANSLSLFKHK